MPKPHPKEFRDDVVAVARRREPGVLLKQIAADFGISESPGRITGTPTTAGTYTFTVRVTDDEDAFAKRTISITVS